jgi:uncharacterized protein
MTALNLIYLIGVFFFTAFISVVTGGTSLITMPVMMQLGIEPHVAVATNMLTLISLSLGGTVAFLKGQIIPRKRLPALIGLTLIGSILGALLLLAVPAKAMPFVVALAMIVVAVFSLTAGNAGVLPYVGNSARASQVAGYGLTFILGVYGGFFSGGYVALLTAAFIAYFGMTFLEAIAVTKLLNLCSSIRACAAGLLCSPAADERIGREGQVEHQELEVEARAERVESWVRRQFIKVIAGARHRASEHHDRAIGQIGASHPTREDTQSSGELSTG